MPELFSRPRSSKRSVTPTISVIVGNLLSTVKALQRMVRSESIRLFGKKRLTPKIMEIERSFSFRLLQELMPTAFSAIQIRRNKKFWELGWKADLFTSLNMGLG